MASLSRITRLGAWLVAMAATLVVVLLAPSSAIALAQAESPAVTGYESAANNYHPAVPVMRSDSAPVVERGPPGASAVLPVSDSVALRGASIAAKTATTLGGHSLDDLSRAAGAVDRNGLSGAGRALQKHGDRAGSAFPRSTGTAAERNAQGQAVVDDILTAPGGRTEVLDNVMHVYDSSGRGVRFRTDGSFMGFLEPR